MIVLVTGANGFIGKNLCAELSRIESLELRTLTSQDGTDKLHDKLTGVNCVFHLAGCNRPTDPKQFGEINHGLTKALCDTLKAQGNQAKIVLSSSTQVALENDYGKSKLAAEQELESLSINNGNPVSIFRLTNVFGKWAKPNYNSAVATFANNISKGFPIEISDPSKVMNLVYIDDVVQAMLSALAEETKGVTRPEIDPIHTISLGGIVEILNSIRDSRQTLVLPDMSDALVRKLYATYMSYCEGTSREYGLAIKTDPRGSLAEFIKSDSIGQIFVSRTNPGITRGNHYHNTKAEKFLVLEGDALIRLRKIGTSHIEEHIVNGSDYRVVDMTPGWTHSITNIGSGTLVTLFWAGEIFNPEIPDTVFTPVEPEANV